MSLKILDKLVPPLNITISFNGEAKICFNIQQTQKSFSIAASERKGNFAAVCLNSSFRLDAGIIAILSIVDSLFLTNLLNSVSDPGADILSFPQQLFTVLNTYLISDCGNNIVGYIFFAQFT